MTMLPEAFADLEPFAATWCLRTEGERYGRRLASTMDEMQTFYDAAFPRLGEALSYLDQYPLDALPGGGHPTALAVLLAGAGVVPGGGVAPAPGARQRRGRHRGDHRARHLRQAKFGPTAPTR